jgi:hypothetical protein
VELQNLLGKNMNHTINVYCDESGHLEHDNSKSMVFGAVWCPKPLVHEITSEIRDLKRKNKINPYQELKWTKISPGNVNLYLDVIDYFFLKDYFNFRGWIIANKSEIDCKSNEHTWDDFYYKSYYDHLKHILDLDYNYNIYLDVKDTYGGEKIEKLKKILHKYTYGQEVINYIQLIRSHESELLAVADVITGALNYYFRNLRRSKAKREVIAKIIKYHGSSFYYNSASTYQKFSIFHWKPGYPRKVV